MAASSHGRSASTHSSHHASLPAASDGDSVRSLPPSHQFAHVKSSRRNTLRFASSRLPLLHNPLHRDDDAGSRDAAPLGNAWSSREPSRSRTHSRSNNTSRSHSRNPSRRTSVDGSGAALRSTVSWSDDEGAPAAGDDSPLQFSKRESASASELFYDLWFVANLTVFATVHPITERETLVSFIGYFFLLWITWVVTTIYDTRFGQDGIVERLARAAHLAVMIGFAMFSVSFDQNGFEGPIYQIMSCLLVVSRFVLALQYAIVLYHARHHARTRNALILTILIHFLAMIAYLVAASVSFEFRDTYLLGIWYGVGLVEMVALVCQATWSRTLSFEGTHFNERLNLLTLIVLGEGVIILSKSVSTIVEYTYMVDITTMWSSALIGIIACAAAMLYIIFQLYFDWMHHPHHMSACKQAGWTIVHLPFHVALVLLAEGGGQSALWRAANEVLRSAEHRVRQVVTQAIEQSGMTSVVIQALEDTAYSFIHIYDYDLGESTTHRLQEAFASLRTLPDDFWDTLQPGLDVVANATDPDYQLWSHNYLRVSSTVFNSVAEAFDINAAQPTYTETSNNQWLSPEYAAVRSTAERYILLFVYVYLCAGIVLLLLMFMHILSRRRGWSLFNILRTAFVFLIGLALSLTSLLALNRTLVTNFIDSPWLLPTVTICYVLVLVLTHLPHPPRIFIAHTELSEMERGRVYEKPEDEPMTPAMVFRHRLTTIGQNARNIRIVAGRSDPIMEPHSFERPRRLSHESPFNYI
ncbi:bacterial low temperature requirement A protein-domain-containing protein [Stachybotrys elegans]|uniref:Bacterial low temperature requirement A protein-domain-containing protein n=1 Tax=Stachybotrys elegans TaxID=80388 RepID=A0A8K0T0E5_9HYPO|nr:bacterial low temperature requirement A protein-domain-containing protein [Stachybotrys elegans]